MRKAMVLGGYGLIGTACMRALQASGFDVTGVGRSQRAALMSAPNVEWVIRDIPSISAEEWRELLSDIDVLVNASGALQDGGKDSLEAIHVTALDRLVEGTRDSPVNIVQISAAGVSQTASTAFFRTKAQGDAIVQSSAGPWVILRPTLVISADAYGGTALLRAAAAIPYVAPQLMKTARIQSVFVDDVADAVVAAATGQVPSGTIADLTERESRFFPQLVDRVREWQGWPAPVLRPNVPGFVLSVLSRSADVLGYLGWRSPLRSTALRALSEGVTGDPAVWEKAGGRPCRSLDETLSIIPATRQERLFARAYLALPFVIGTLSMFWILSGLITFVSPTQAMTILTDRGLSGWIVPVTVIGGAIADIVLGFAILWRRWAKTAALGMLCLSAGYLVGSVFVAPDLWADPLGPMVKVFPGMALAAVVWLLMEDR